MILICFTHQRYNINRQGWEQGDHDVDRLGKKFKEPMTRSDCDLCNRTDQRIIRQWKLLGKTEEEIKQLSQDIVRPSLVW